MQRAFPAHYRARHVVLRCFNAVPRSALLATTTTSSSRWNYSHHGSSGASILLVKQRIQPRQQHQDDGQQLWRYFSTDSDQQQQQEEQVSTKSTTTDNHHQQQQQQEEVVTDEGLHFKDLINLDPRTLSSIEKMGLSEMTPIQAASYAPISSGKDVLARAQTGTGKTFAFLVPTIQRLLLLNAEQAAAPSQDNNKIQVLILSPTRELALQIESQVEALLTTTTTENHPLSSQTMFGGIPKYQDISRMRDRLPNILVATPGRLVDHLHNTSIDGQSFRAMLSKVDVLILDEADRYIDMGSDIPTILSAVPKKRQTLLFSATLPESVLAFLHNFMKPDFDRIDCISHGSDQTSKIVDQSHVILKTNMVIGIVEIIRHYMDKKNDDPDAPPTKILVFFPTTAMVAFFAKIFNFGLGGNYVLEIHSKKTQAYRTSVSKRFRTLDKGTLFSSDVSARGVDYPGITHVIQIGLPSSSESYVHRLGRTGRAKSTGEGILILSETEQGFLKTLEEGIQVPVNVELQALVESDKSTKIRRDLEPVLESIRSGTNESLHRAAEETYRSVLGYYNGKLKDIGVKGLPKLVNFCNSIATQIGLSRIPGINRSTAQNLGLDKVPGIVMEDPRRRGERGGVGRKKQTAYRPNDAVVGTGDYDSWGTGKSSKQKRSSSNKWPPMKPGASWFD